MKLKTIFSFPVTALILIIFAVPVAATPYGSGAYGECVYEGSAGTCEASDSAGGDGKATDGKATDGTAEDGEPTAGDSETSEDGEDGAPIDGFDATVPPTVAMTTPIGDDDLRLVPLILSIAALLGAAFLIFWASRRRRADAYVPPPTFVPPQTPPAQPIPPIRPPVEPGAPAKTDVNLMPSPTAVASGTTVAGAGTGQSSPRPATDSASVGGQEPTTPQVGQVIAPDSGGQPDASPATDSGYSMPANTPPEMIDKPSPGVSYRDIHGPGSSS